MLTEASKELAGMLKNIRNDKNFILGIMSNASSEVSRKKMIDYISAANNRNEVIMPEDLVALSVILSE